MYTYKVIASVSKLGKLYHALKRKRRRGGHLSLPCISSSHGVASGTIGPLHCCKVGIRNRWCAAKHQGHSSGGDSMVWRLLSNTSHNPFNRNNNLLSSPVALISRAMDCQRPGGNTKDRLSHGKEIGLYRNSLALTLTRVITLPSYTQKSLAQPLLL